MKWLKWILGVIMAGVITIWPASFIMHHTGQVDMNHLTPFQHWVKFLLVPSLAFGLFLFLACVFVPLRKKQAAYWFFHSALFLLAWGLTNIIPMMAFWLTNILFGIQVLLSA